MKVCDGGEEVESQAESLSTVSVSVLENAKPFEVAQGVFHHNAACCQSSVLLFLFVGERVKFAFFVRRLAVGVEFVHAFIAGICQEFNA